MELKGLKVNFLGDSITEGYKCNDKSHLYWKQLAEKDGVTARGYGISGTRIALQQSVSQETSYDQYFRSRVHLMEKDADVVFVFGGTNDWGHGDAPIGSFTDRTDDTFYGAYHALLEELIETYPTALIVPVTPLHRKNESDSVNEWGFPQPTPFYSYIRAIREVSEYYGLRVLDLYATSGLQPKVKTIQDTYMPDGLHPNEAGHDRLYALFRSFLASI